jgi:hypothetical protein
MTILFLKEDDNTGLKNGSSQSSEISMTTTSQQKLLEPRLGSASDPAQLAVRASRRLHGPRSTEHTHQDLGLTHPKRLA